MLKPYYSTGQLDYFLFYDTYDKDNFAFVKKFLRHGMVVVDIGANLGLYSLFFSKYVGNEGRVFSFEPVKQSFEQLQYNVSLNKFKNIELFNFGLSNESAQILIYKDKENDGANSIVYQDNSFGSERITVMKFDDLWEKKLSKELKKIDLVKIDVEGWEPMVLKGMVSFLNNNNPLILMEHNGPRYKVSSIRAFKILTSMGYVCWVINGNRLEEVSEINITNDYNNIFIDFCYSKETIRI